MNRVFLSCDEELLQRMICLIKRILSKFVKYLSLDRLIDKSVQNILEM